MQIPENCETRLKLKHTEVRQLKLGFGKIDVRGDNFDTSGDKCHLNCGLKKKDFRFMALILESGQKEM